MAVCCPLLRSGIAYGIGSLRDEVRVQEILMRELIIGVVVDVLGHVRIQHLNGSRVRWIATSARDLAGVRDASEFIVLHPKVGLEDFRRSRKPEQCGVPRCEPPATLFWTFFS